MVLTSLLFLFSPPIAFIMGTYLTSFYAFEYFWMNSGLELEQSIGLLHSHYWYFLGFGIPASAIVVVWPQIIGSGVFALLFPLVGECFYHNM
jgi:etoposide-induced 2.4 mRNA